MEIRNMLKSNENQDLSYVGLQLSEIIFLLDHADDFGTKYILEQIRESAQSAMDRFQQPEGIIEFVRKE